MNQPQYRLAWPPITKSMIALIVVFVVLWLGSLQGSPLHEISQQYLLLTAPGLTERYAAWSVATYAFFHRGFFDILFSAIALWLFGGDLVHAWSTARFWGMQAIAAIVGALFCIPILLFADTDMVVMGFQAPAMALVFAYCWQRWHVRQHFFFFEMTGRTMLLLFLGLGLVVSLFGHWPTIVLDLAGCLVGFIASKGKFNFRDLRTRFRLWQARRKLKIVKSPEDDRPPRKTADGQYIN